MNHLSMSLALFFCAVFATTSNAAPSYLKKDGESPSVRRSLEDIEIADAELKCNVFETFNNLGKGEDSLRVRDGSPDKGWSDVCESFTILEEFLCPTENAVVEICSENKPLKNRAVKKNFCIPTFAILEEDRRKECIKFCTNYASAARGNCCDIDCTSE